MTKPPRASRLLRYYLFRTRRLSRRQLGTLQDWKMRVVFWIGALMVGLVCLVMGMGLPTTAAYVLVAAVLAPALTEVGIPPLTAHLFVFYFGIMADVTPPVGLASFAAAAVSGGDPIKTGAPSRCPSCSSTTRR